MINEYLIYGAFIVFAYLLGSVSSAIVTCKLMHLPDPRSEGSGNPGATNVLRLGGKKAAIITLLGDVLKGVIPVLLAKWVGISGVALALVALAAFLGHLFPLYFGFKGGKGVATSFGAITALSWPIGLAAFIIWLVVALLFRYSSLAAICAAFCMPLLAYYLAPHSYISVLVLLALIILIMHRDNMLRIIKGTESKIGRKS